MWCYYNMVITVLIEYLSTELGIFPAYMLMCTIMNYHLNVHSQDGVTKQVLLVFDRPSYIDSLIEYEDTEDKCDNAHASNKEKQAYHATPEEKVSRRVTI